MTYLLDPGGAVLRQADGCWIPDDPANADRQTYAAWLAAGHVPEPYAVPTPPVRELAPLDCFDLFTPAERAALRAAARQPGGDAIEDWLDMVRVARSVNLDDPRTVAGLAALAGAGLISSARHDQVLAGLTPEA
jgi:hypothetical protein